MHTASSAASHEVIELREDATKGHAAVLAKE